MSKIRDLTGDRYGRLKVLELVGKTKHRKLLWRCLCDCGREIVVIGNSLRMKRTLSCGCYNADKNKRQGAEKVANLVGQRFGRLTVIEHGGKNKSNKHIWNCLCDCGKKHLAGGDHLRSGNVKSCGCYMIDQAKLANTVHGQSHGTRTYNSWRSMIGRCYNPKSTGYDLYGGRGITVCHRWRNNFPNFLADMGERPPNKTLDRIDPNGNYTPSNTRWASPLVQTLNRRCTRRAA